VEAPRAPTPTAQALDAVTRAPSPRPGEGFAVSSSTAVATSQPVVAASPAAAAPVAGAPPTAVPPSCAYGPTKRLVEVQDRALKEASALAASQKSPGVYWTLNDSGNSPTVYAVDEQGRSRGSFRVDDAENVDWESLQVGPGTNGGSALYIGDTGDNDRKRREIVIYRVPEPDPLPIGGRSSNGRTAPAEAFRLQFPAGAHDTEAILVHPVTGELLVVTKTQPGRATVYRAPMPLNARQRATMEKVADLDMARAGVKIDVVTDGAVSADARRVAIRTYSSALEFDVPPGAALASIWEQAPRFLRIDDPPQGEGLSYRADGTALITIGESNPTYLYEIPWQC
jgi:hypothetical protein